MSSTDRQTRLNITEDWKRVYQSFRNADFQSYDFDNLRRTMINYLRQNYPEDFNDYVESSEYIALIDLIAFLGQNLSFRVDLNARENFLETAERRESILRLARLISYNPKRNISANGLLKIDTVKTTEDIIDSSGINLNSKTIRWNDISNASWFEQFTRVINNALPLTSPIGRPLQQESIGGVKTEKYKFNSSNTDTPVFSYQKTIEGLTTDFEVVSIDIENATLVEEPPLPGNNPGLVYRDDGQGAGSTNTGFFMMFKQGKMQSGDFRISSPVPNQVVAIDSENINNDDVWLYSISDDGFEEDLWSKIDSVEGNNIIYNSLLKDITKTFAVTTRVGDRVNLIFSDGVFGELPSGNFRSYYRTSANRAMNITPQSMTGVRIEVPYISRSGSQEVLTLNMSLKYTVSNSTSSETNDSIKTNAPASYYTQNRLITAEDYNIGPLAISQDILKTRAVNRVASGISKFFEIKDATGRYSNLDIYSSDGVLYKEDYEVKTSFGFTTQNDIEGVIYNVIEPILDSKKTLNFYYDKFSKVIVSDLNAKWNSMTDDTNLSTGFFSDADGAKYTIGRFTLNSLRLLEVGTLCKFEAPEGFHFMSDGTLMSGAPDHLGSKDYLWSKVVIVTGDGTDDSQVFGPIGFNDKIPDGAILTEIRTRLANTLTDDVKLQIIDRAFAYQDFALRYDNELRSWFLITNENINTVSEFSNGKAGDLSGQGLDASWILYFKTNGENYTITYRQLRYIFESANDIRFFFDESDKIYDPSSGKIFKDRIDILNINTKPDSLEPFTNNWVWSIENAFRDKAGYVNSRKIEVSFFDSDSDGVIDDPDIFTQIVAPSIGNKIIFQEKYTTTDGVEDFKYVSNENIEIVQNISALNSIPRTDISITKVYYLLEEDIFQKYNADSRTFFLTADYLAFVGRDKIKFHYIHTASGDYRIDPSVSNIIDVYLLTKGYDTEFKLYLNGELNTKPLPPSSDNLFRTYGSQINAIKSISDEIIYHPVKYKVLFGQKANDNLQVTFKVVKNKELSTNDNQIKSDIIDAIDRFFETDNWDFGDTFYFSELSSYIMSQLSPNIVSFLMVPRQPNQLFGSLYEIQSEPNEIFISGATVTDIEIIDEITASKLQASGGVVTSDNDPNIGIQSSSDLLNLSSENATSTTSTSSANSTNTSSTSTSSSSSSSSNTGSTGGGYSY